MGRVSTGAVPIVAAMALLAIGCSTDGTDAGQRGSASLTEADEARAIELFQDQGCPVCHGDSGEGVDGAGPALRDLAPYWNVERLSAYLRDPRGFRAANPDFERRRDTESVLEMPAYGALSEEERALLGRWLMTR